MRRNRDAVHRHFARRHDDARWRGEARRFGEGMAILVGDFAFVYADMLDPRRAARCSIRVFDQLRIELCVGQSLDLVTTATGEHRPRSGATHRAVQVGEVHGRAAAAPRCRARGPARRARGRPLSAIGVPLGDAFQLRDDVLGAFGEADVTGKPVGDDLREGKATPLVALAAARAGTCRPGAARAARRVGPRRRRGRRAPGPVRPHRGPQGGRTARSNASSATRTRPSATAPITTDARVLLGELADYVAWRDH